MKLGVGISVFNGIELLPYMLKQIRDEVSFITVSFQNYDWYGKNRIKKEDLKLLLKLYREGMINELHEFKITKYAEDHHEAQKLESLKRKENRDICIDRKMEYFLDLDCDEFYKKDEFKKAKDFIFDNDINYSIVEYVNYFKLPIYQVERNSDFGRYVPFICKIIDEDKLEIENNTRITKNGVYLSVDKTRFYNTEEKPFLFSHQDILMHHFTGVRKDIENKFISYSGKSDAIENKIELIKENINGLKTDNLKFDEKFELLLFPNKNQKIIKVENYFKIPLEEFI